MADIFVSYASADRDRVWLVVQALRAEGFSVWWDRDVPASAQWEPTIVAALEAAKCVIVFWSRASVASENVRSEARPARKAGRLIQAFLERCEAPHFFGEQQGADLVEWSGDRSAERFQFLVLGVRDLLAGRRPKEGLGFRPKVGSAWPLPGAALIVAASAGILWLPEVRARLFPSAPIVWRMTPGPSIDIRPALPPESAEADRMGSAVLIGMQPGFASEGGRRGEAVVSSQTVSLQFPDKPPITFNWWIFSNNADQGPYINQLGAAAPLALADGAGGREAMFQPVGDYVWAQFVADVKDAYSNGADELGILVKAEVQTEGRRDMLTARCDQPLEPIMLLIAESNAGLPRWIVRNCAVADAPPASDHKTNQEN